MDQRLIVTVPFVVHLIGGTMLAAAYSMAPVEFTEGQLEFVVLVTYLCPAIAMGLIWAKNYVYGAPLLVGSAISSSWFAIYFFVLHGNPANIYTVADRSYTYAIVAVIMGSLLIAGAGLWLWYRESEGFRSAIDSVVRPPDSQS